MVGPLMFVVIGLTGLAGLCSGTSAARLGVARTAALSLLVISASLAVLALSGTVVGLLASAAMFGAGYMVGAACLSIWTAQLDPARAAATFTSALLVGAAASIVTPTVGGLVVQDLGLSVLLLWTAALAAGSGVVATALGSRIAPGPARIGL